MPSLAIISVLSFLSAYESGSGGRPDEMPSYRNILCYLSDDNEKIE